MDQKAKTKLLTVEDTFLIEGRGVVLMPAIPVSDSLGSSSESVLLRKQNGDEMVVQAQLEIPRVNPPPAVYTCCCLLVGMTKQDVPIGSEIWF